MSYATFEVWGLLRFVVVSASREHNDWRDTTTDVTLRVRLIPHQMWNMGEIELTAAGFLLSGEYGIWLEVNPEMLICWTAGFSSVETMGKKCVEILKVPVQDFEWSSIEKWICCTQAFEEKLSWVWGRVPQRYRLRKVYFESPSAGVLNGVQSRNADFWSQGTALLSLRRCTLL